MKKIVMMLLAVGTLFTTHGQIALESQTHTPKIGEFYSYHYAISPAISVETGGQNMVWDFSAIHSDLKEFQIMNPLNTPIPSYFPTSTYAESHDGRLKFYIGSTTSIAQVGEYEAGKYQINYSNPREILRFPLTYFTEYTDDFEGVVANLSLGQDYERSGTIEMKADGFGTLITHYRSIMNVLRVRVISNYTDSYLGNVTNVYSDTLYLWFNAINHSFLASYGKTWDNGALINHFGYVMTQQSFISSVEENIQISNVSIYPNPTTDEIIIQSNSPITQIRIIDLSGKVVQQIPTTALPITHSVRDMEPGMYLFQYVEKGINKSIRLIIQ